MTQAIKESDQIEQLLADPWAVDIQAIWEQALHNPDPDKRQEQIINEKKFVV